MKKDKKPTHAWGIASLILGILSLLFFLAPYIGIFLAITAVVFYGIQKKQEPTGAATGGLVTGIIGIIINGVMLIIIILGVVLFSAFSSSSSEVQVVSSEETPIVNESNNITDTTPITTQKVKSATITIDS